MRVTAVCRRFLIACMCALPLWFTNVQAATFGQTPAFENQITRFLVRLTLETANFTTFCTGTLISNDEVLTAGHCLMGEIAKALTNGHVFAEFQDKSGSRRRVPIVKANWKFGSTIDLGVAFLGVSAGFTGNEFPPIATAPCSKKGFLYPFGYGLDENGTLPPNAKMTVYRETGGNEDFISAVSDSALTGRNCFGDSGGPVVCEQYGRPVIASVNSLISGDLVAWFKSVFKMIDRPEMCAQMNNFYGIRLHAQKALLSELRTK